MGTQDLGEVGRESVGDACVSHRDLLLEGFEGDFGRVGLDEVREVCGGDFGEEEAWVGFARVCLAEREQEALGFSFLGDEVDGHEDEVGEAVVVDELPVEQRLLLVVGVMQ